MSKEINEAALANVSGGKSTPEAAMDAAAKYCAACDRAMGCDHLRDLAKYQEAMGIGCLSGPSACPYRQD